MPKAEDNEEHVPTSLEPWSPRENIDSLESGQRYGLMEDERTISGQKRICFCYGYTRSWCENRFLPCFLVMMYSILCMYGGYYSGYNSHCICDNVSV